MLLTIVSGYWNVKGAKHTIETFHKWFKNTLLINCPYVFFGDKEAIDYVKKIRINLPTTYVEMEMTEFETYQYKNNLIEHSVHCPCKELLLIWNEKIFLLHKAKKINPYNSDFFMWVDAGVCIYRSTPPPSVPFPDNEKLHSLPKNKFIFTSSDFPWFQPERVHDNHYYHFIAGTSYMIHINFIDDFTELYRQYCRKYLSQYNWINSDQKILTHIYNDFPELFHQIGHGYGEILNLLY